MEPYCTRPDCNRVSKNTRTGCTISVKYLLLNFHCEPKHVVAWIFTINLDALLHSHAVSPDDLSISTPRQSLRYSLRSLRALPIFLISINIFLSFSVYAFSFYYRTSFGRSSFASVFQYYSTYPETSEFESVRVWKAQRTWSRVRPVTKMDTKILPSRRARMCTLILEFRSSSKCLFYNIRIGRVPFSNEQKHLRVLSSTSKRNNLSSYAEKTKKF